MIMCESAIAPPQFHLFWREGPCFQMVDPDHYHLKNDLATH